MRRSSFGLHKKVKGQLLGESSAQVHTHTHTHKHITQVGRRMEHERDHRHQPKKPKRGITCKKGDAARHLQRVHHNNRVINGPDDWSILQKRGSVLGICDGGTVTMTSGRRGVAETQISTGCKRYNKQAHIGAHWMVVAESRQLAEAS